MLGLELIRISNRGPNDIVQRIHKYTAGLGWEIFRSVNID